MSVNIVNKTTGDLTPIAGNVYVNRNVTYFTA